MSTKSEQTWICALDDTTYSSVARLHTALFTVVRDIAPAFVDCTAIRLCYLDLLLGFPFKFVVVARVACATGQICVRPEDAEALDLWLEWMAPRAPV